MQSPGTSGSRSLGTEQRRLAAIMFTDMVGYSALVERNEALALELLEEHRLLLRSLFPQFNGAEIKTIGDAFLVEFGSALEAAQCAIEIQRTLAQRNLSAPADRQLQLHIGIHVGDIVHRDGDVLGDGVNIASRIEPLAEPSGICISMDVERQIRNALEARLEKLEPRDLKNIQVPMELFRIVLPWEQAATFRPAKPVGAKRLSLVRAVLALAVALLAVAAALAWWTQRKPSSHSATTSSGIKSVAVLPFANFGSDAADEYLSDGVTEEIIGALSRLKGIKVPARTSSFAFKGKNQDIRAIGEQLGVTTVLEGSVRKAGNKIRITAQLINIADGFHIWSQTYDREAQDIFAVETDVARSIAEAFKIDPLPQDLQRRPTVSAEAHDSYLRGRYFLDRRDKHGFEQAAEWFQRAISIDPAYALAWAGLADTYTLMGRYEYRKPGETFPRARTAALKALEIDPSLAEAHTSLGGIYMWYDWDWNKAEAAFRRAIELNPEYPAAHHWYCVFLGVQGRHEQSLAEMRRAWSLDPLSIALNANLGHSLSMVGQFEEAVRQLQETIKMAPGFVSTYEYMGYMFWLKGDMQKAVESYRKAAELGDYKPNQRAQLAWIYAAAEQKAEALKGLGEVRPNDNTSFLPAAQIAMAYTALGEKDLALQYLEQAFEQRSFLLIYLKTGRHWEPLRSDPRFTSLLHKVGF